MSQKVKYSDFDLLFIDNPVTQDVSKKLDNNAIKQSIKNIVLTKPLERPFQPDFGSDVFHSLFELVNPFTIAKLQRQITYSITNFEPRVKVNQVMIEPDLDSNLLNVQINYTIINTGLDGAVNITLQRTR